MNTTQNKATQWRVVGPLSATKLKWAIADASGRFLSYSPFPTRPYIRRERRFKSATAAEKFIARMSGGAQ